MEAELVLEELSELVDDPEELELVLAVCEDVGLDDADDEEVDVGTAVAVEDELADALGVRVDEAVDEPLVELVNDDDAEGVGEALAVEVALVDELEDDEPLSVDEAEPDAVFEGVRV